VLEAMRSRFPEMRYAPSCDITSLTEKESVFDRFTDSEGKPGMRADYWNNTRMEGAPAATVNYTAALTLDNGGNTVFAPGVELENFTTRMRGTLTAAETEELDILFNNDDGFRIIVNGDTVHNRWKGEALAFRSMKLPVEKGKSYDIEINYMQLDGGATLNFDICRARTLSLPEIAARAKDVETVVFVGGISPALEREQARVQLPGFDNGDRTSIELPQAQRDIIRTLHEAGKKVVLVNCSGSAVALTPENEICDAILQAWYPGEQGGEAVAEVLMGEYNPSGKLPVTFYADDSQLPAFEDYNMAGRTYRYLQTEPLYPFGHGLSYTTFSYGKPKFRNGLVTVEVRNTGDRAGTEIVQLYMRRPSDTAGPVKSLRGYARVELRPGEKKTVTLPMPRGAFENWDENERRMRVVPGDYELMVGPSSAAADLATLKVKIK
ncbi:MAG: glycoside hydrolase family 3 C-terminal domain-containing protein, partial [Muribaculaceae bacterium]|nr:glycoside hydrolase family 3 C-terminal domain-containing protein [Muribaculaceae bacterium]